MYHYGHTSRHKEDAVATANKAQQIRVFIGSSGEARPIVRIVKNQLEKRKTKQHKVKVIPWDSDEFTAGGRFILDLLLNAPDEYDFDFAIFLFQPDDAITSREQSYYIPRDSVIFELGIFMSKLGMKRTFVLAPREAELKVMSDLQNYIPDYYARPQFAKTKAGKLENLQKVLTPAIERIAKRMDRVGPRDTQLEGAGWVSPLLTEYFKVPATARVVKNYALDLGATWNIFHALLEKPELRNITVQTLMMDGSSEELIAASGDSPTAAQALISEKNVVSYCQAQNAEMKKRHIVFECRKYSRVPFVHGFLMRGYKLLLSTLSFDKGKMIGTPNPYWEIDYPKPTSRSGTIRHSFKAYEKWFDDQWAAAVPVWPPQDMS